MTNYTPTKKTSSSVARNVALGIGVILFVVVGYWVLGAAWAIFTSFFFPILFGAAGYYLGKKRGTAIARKTGQLPLTY